MINYVFIVPYIIAGGVMWFIVHAVAPLGKEYGLGQTIWGIVTIGLCESATEWLLSPHIGHWWIPVGFGVSVFVVMGFFELRFWPSVLATFIYYAVFFVAIIVILLGAEFLPSKKPVPPHLQSRAPLSAPGHSPCTLIRFHQAPV